MTTAERARRGLRPDHKSRCLALAGGARGPFLGSLDRGLKRFPQADVVDAGEMPLENDRSAGIVVGRGDRGADLAARPAKKVGVPCP